MATDKDRANDGDANRRPSGTGRERDSSTSYGATEREQTEDLRRRILRRTRTSRTAA
jgi:hypothetical protein